MDIKALLQQQAATLNQKPAAIQTAEYFEAMARMFRAQAGETKPRVTQFKAHAEKKASKLERIAVAMRKDKQTQVNAMLTDAGFNQAKTGMNPTFAHKDGRKLVIDGNNFRVTHPDGTAVQHPMAALETYLKSKRK